MNTSITAPIFPITPLSKQSKEVKDAADKGPVRITENGRGAYVFMSEQALNDLIERERADAAYEAYLPDAVHRGAIAIEEGRSSTRREQMFARACHRTARYE